LLREELTGRGHPDDLAAVDDRACPFEGADVQNGPIQSAHRIELTRSQCAYPALKVVSLHGYVRFALPHRRRAHAARSYDRHTICECDEIERQNSETAICGHEQLRRAGRIY
jgi:hypothetical protein